MEVGRGKRGGESKMEWRRSVCVLYVCTLHTEFPKKNNKQIIIMSVL